MMASWEGDLAAATIDPEVFALRPDCRDANPRTASLALTRRQPGAARGRGVHHCPARLRGPSGV